MAVGDIYRVTLNYEGPTQAASTSIYYIESVLSTAVIGPVNSVNFSFQFSKLISFLNVLSDNWWVPSTRCERLTGLVLPPDLLTTGPANGNRAGVPLPANNCLLMQLLQQLFPRVSNGRMYLPGLSESDAEVGLVETVFLNGLVVTLGNAISAVLDENDGTGEWLPGVISAKARDAGPGPPDWAAGFSPIIAALGNPVIARQRRRTTKVIGQSRATT